MSPTRLASALQNMASSSIRPYTVPSVPLRRLASATMGSSAATASGYDARLVRILPATASSITPARMMPP